MSVSNFWSSGEKNMESQKIKEAIDFLQSSNLVSAQKILSEVISTNPKNDEAFHLLGLIHSQSNNLKDAQELIAKAITLNPLNPIYYSNMGEVSRLAGKLQEAIDNLKKAISLNPTNSAFFYNLGICYNQLGDFNQAKSNYLQAIKLDKNNYLVFFLLGNLCAEMKNFYEAIDAYNCSIRLNPQHALTWTNLGHANEKINNFNQAIDCYSKSISINPLDPIPYSNLGNTLLELKKYNEAVEVCARSIELNPNFAPAYSNMADALYGLKRYNEAIINYQKALDLDPKFAQAYFNLSNTLVELEKPTEAIKSLDLALEFDYSKSNHANIYFNRGNILWKRDIRAALLDYESALEINSKTETVLGTLMHGYLRIFKWDRYEKIKKIITQELEEHQLVANPMQLMSVFNSLLFLKNSAIVYTRKHFLPSENQFIKINKKQNSKIRIGYFSADFKDHPVAYLLAEVLNLHDKNQFEVYAFSFSSDKLDAYTHKIRASVDHFYDVTQRTPDEIIKFARDCDIDVAIDLGIFSGKQLPVFKDRVAAVQVNFLGYAGTSGASFMDYIVADDFVIPSLSEEFYTEKILRLPCFMPRDTRVVPSLAGFNRSTFGLPEKSFVFACISGYGKILPEVFECWMRILKQVPGSCLWIGEEDKLCAADELKSHAKKLGVDAERIIFAKRQNSYELFLGRLTLADLCLDTFPYGAHTMCNDALWAGVPVLTCVGETFASRVAGSLLTKLQLSELITKDFQEYENRAVRYGTNPHLIVSIKEKLKTNQVPSLLFNTPYYTKKLEEGLRAIYDLSINNHCTRNVTIASGDI